MAREDYGLLVNPDAKLQRSRFREMTKLLGINAIYEAPINKDYTLQGELVANKYQPPEVVGCIFQDHIDQKTSKLLGWNAELATEASVIHVPYDLHDIQIGALFTIPSAFDDAPGRKFRVVEMSTTMIYPASVSCRLALEYENETEAAEIEQFNNSNFNLLYEGDGN